MKLSFWERVKLVLRGLKTAGFRKTCNMIRKVKAMPDPVRVERDATGRLVPIYRPVRNKKGGKNGCKKGK